MSPKTKFEAHYVWFKHYSHSMVAGGFDEMS
jgi:hypothetical protein